LHGVVLQKAIPCPSPPCDARSKIDWAGGLRGHQCRQQSFGDDEAQLGQYAWYRGNSGRKTQPVTKIRTLIQASVFDSESEQAEELLASGYKAAAAVIAGVVLETSIRQLCEDNGIATGKLDRMNADLAKAGVYNQLRQKQITVLAHIRNDAAHGKADQFTEAHVSNMIRDIRNLLANDLS
jgi:hypothetical protein